MKRSVFAMLFIAPSLLFFAGFVPLILLDNWLKTEAGMPLMADISEHPWGSWVEDLMGVLLMAFLVLGYFAGWLVNAVWLLTVRRWSLSRIKAIFFNSQLPGSWLRQKELRVEQLQALQMEFAEWGQTRTAGRASYLIKNGMRISSAFFVALACARVFGKDAKLLSSSWLHICILSVGIGMAISAMLWFWREHRFAYRAQFRDEGGFQGPGSTP